MKLKAFYGLIATYCYKGLVFVKSLRKCLYNYRHFMLVSLYFTHVADMMFLFVDGIAKN